MKFPTPLIPGRLERRYKRFLCDVMVEGKLLTAHCANPGSMLGLCEAGEEVFLSRSDNPKRKLSFSLELVRAGPSGGGTLVGVNTILANRLVEEALKAGEIPQLAGYDKIRREVPYGKNSRIDFLLEGAEKPPCYVEVKSVTLSRQKGLAEFPDSVTARGAKHLAELAERAREGARAVMLFLIQRGDCVRFDLARDIDPAYEAAFLKAGAEGVESLCYKCALSLEGIKLDREVECGEELMIKGVA